MKIKPKKEYWLNAESLTVEKGAKYDPNKWRNRMRGISPYNELQITTGEMIVVIARNKKRRGIDAEEGIEGAMSVIFKHDFRYFVLINDLSDEIKMLNGMIESKMNLRREFLNRSDFPQT